MARPSNQFACPRCGAQPGFNCTKVTTSHRATVGMAMAGEPTMVNHPQRTRLLAPPVRDYLRPETVQVELIGLGFHHTL